MKPEHVDVLIIGAGLSGIGAACHLQRECPERSYAIVEAREASGGTWDLFRYPGVRSDSDMHTLGYRFRPWEGEKALAGGASILAYIRKTAEAYGVNDKIRYGHKVVSARWESGASRWHITMAGADGATSMTCNWLHVCAGYYSYDQGHDPEFEGRARFQGDIIHPQHWPEAYDYSGKKVVVIGSGATAVTLVPAMAEQADHVTMLQRSPSYVFSLPARDKLANRLRKLLPGGFAYRLTRMKNILRMAASYSVMRKYPKWAKSFLLGKVQAKLGDEYDVSTHFTPRYNPWDQRLCFVPNSDLFRAIKGGKATIVTDHVKRFTDTGVELASGEVLDADIIVTATGLKLSFLGGMAFEVDGRQINPADEIMYKNAMLSNVPNMTSVFGYINASWTLRADLTSEFLCRLLKQMRKENFVEVRPVPDGPVERRDFLSFSSGYVQRSIDTFPGQGARAPWTVSQNYLADVASLRFGRLMDNALKRRRAGDGPIDVKEVTVLEDA